MEIRWDSGRTVSVDRGERRHLDYGYAVTSHSSQGQTADGVLVHVEAERAGEKLVNQRLAYVAVSRGRDDAQIYTDNKRSSPMCWIGMSRIDRPWRRRRSHPHHGA